MKNYKLSNLLYQEKGEVTGPMSPVLFAQEMAKKCDFKFNRLARVSFEDGEVHNNYEGPNKTELTGCDTLLIAAIYKNDIWVSLWVDQGCSAVPVAMAYKSEPGLVTITPAYEKAAFEKKLSIIEVLSIFATFYNNLIAFEATEKAIL